MSRDEALVSVLNAARALCAQVGPGAALPADLWPVFRQLVDAVAAVEAVGDPAPDAPGSHQDVLSCPPGAKTDAWASSRPEGHAAPVWGRPGFCRGDDSCWRAPITPGGVCFEHSAANQKPRPWQTARLRAGVFAVPEEDADG